MAPSFLNPFYLLAPPILLLFAVPLAVFAAITTALAITTLLIRASIVYFELGLALIHSYLFAESSKASARSSHQSSPHQQQHHRRRRSSTSSSQEFTLPNKHGPHKSDSFASLLGAGVLGPGRDFEGIGGWRDAAPTPGEEALWINMNSRLELPAPTAERRRHQRSLTGGSQRWSGNWSPEAMRMSPAQSRARTPSITDLKMSEGGDEYFPLQVSTSRSSIDLVANKNAREARRKSLGGANEEKKKSHSGQTGDGRRKSSSGSSLSSQSSKASRGTLKQTAYGP
jgi:hypothetical protein